MTSRQAVAFGQIRSVIAWGIASLLLVTLEACQEKTAYKPPPPPRVTVGTPARQEVTDYLELTGNTQAVNTVQLRARVQGYLEKVFFQDGQVVKKGQPLFQIERDTYVAKLKQAEGQILTQQARLEHAKTEFARFSSLVQQRAAAQTDVDQWRDARDSAEGALREAKAARDLARLDLGYTLVTAPFDGRIDRRLVDPGNLVGAGENTILAQMSQLDPIYVYFTVNDLDLRRLLRETVGIPGQTQSKKLPVLVGLPNEEGYPHQGYLDFAAISLTTTTGTLLVRGVLPNPDDKILPGLYARVRLPVEEQSAALLVPQKAVGYDQIGSYVLVVNDKNVVERRNVKTGPVVNGSIVIEEGLTGNERVVVEGLLYAVPGREVTPEPEKAPLAGSPQPDQLARETP
ncbi:MAG: efflux transporter, family, subunit [Deltaproteobacteria bacterium]|nr:efflux transporter, family, subunit [Deltaproteobacteria bacterium]